MDKKRSVMGILAILISVMFIAACKTQEPVNPSGEFCIPDANGVCQPANPSTTTTPSTTNTNIKDITASTGSQATASTETNTQENVPKLVYNVSQLIDLKSRLKVKDDDNNILSYTFGAPFNQDGQWQTTMNDAGEYLVTITVSDGVSQVSKKVLIVVKAQNRAPAIGKMEDVIVGEGDKVILSPVAVDPDGDVLKITYSGWMTDKEYTTKYGDAGEHFVTVTATDGKEKAVQIVKVVVRKANRPPVLETFSDVTVQEGDKVTIVPKVSDPDGDSVSVVYSAPFSDQGIWQTKEGDQGVFRINVTASDGSKATTQTFSIIVKGKNKPPVFISVADKTVNENQELTFTIAASDPENNIVRVSAKELPAGAGFDSNAGIFRWTPGYNIVTPTEGRKKFSATFEATDGTGTSQYTVSIYVNDVNRPPTLDII